MILLDIQRFFNENFNIKDIKAEVENGLRTYLDNHIFLREEFGNDIDVKNLRAEYCNVQIFINTISAIPFFRVKYNVYVKEENLPKFWYEMEFDLYGNIQDDYFDFA